MADDIEPKPLIQRSPGYPFIDLPTAIDRAKAIKEYAGFARKVPISSALKQWNYGAKSGAGHQQIAALIKFGLLDDEGNRDQRTVQLTDRAKRILLGIQGTADRLQAIQAAALAPTIHREIRDRWPHGLPNDEAVGSWLGIEKNFNQNAVPAFLKVLRSTFEFAELDGVPSGGDDEKSKEGEIKAGDWVQRISEGAARFSTPRQVLRVEDYDDGKYAMFANKDGTEGGVLVSQLTVENPAAPGKTLPARPAPPISDTGRQPAQEGLEENRWKLPSGPAVVWLPSKMTERDFKVLQGQLDLLKMSSLDDAAENPAIND